MASNRVLGVAALRKRLAALPSAVKTEVQGEMDKVAGEITSLQKSMVAQNTDSGDLQMSIRYEPFTRGGIGGVIKAGGALTTKPVRNGADAEYDYALANELGTQDMLAQPFFYPAYRRKRSSVRRRASKAVRKAVEITK